MTLLDTHCHLDYPPLGDDVAAVVQRAAAAGIGQCVTVGTTGERSRRSVEIARRHPSVRAAVGVHPNECADATEAMWAELQMLAAEPEVVAIGEVGLDQYRKTVELARQQAVLRRCLDLARQHALPVLLHCRAAYEPLLKTLRELSSSWRGIIHCASGPPEFIQEALALGLHISFAGNVTFPNAQALRALVPLVPDERLLIETDAPFLAPQPVRGKTNEPAYLIHTAVSLAQLRGTTLETFGALTSRNARQLFNVADV